MCSIQCTRIIYFEFSFNLEANVVTCLKWVRSNITRNKLDHFIVADSFAHVDGHNVQLAIQCGITRMTMNWKYNAVFTPMPEYWATQSKGMVLYSAVSSPLDRSKRFTLSNKQYHITLLYN